MKNIIIRTLAGTLCLLFLMSFLAVKDAYPFEAGDDSQPDKLLVLWTSGDREVAIKMVYMYTYNAKKNGWWGKIRFIIWGPSSKLLSEDEELQQETKKMMEEGLEAIEARHQRLGEHCRKGILRLGLGLYAEPGHYSNTVTAATLREGMSAAKVLSDLRTRYDIICGSSKAPGVEMIRIGHMGYVSEADLDQVLAALGELMAC